MATTSTLGSTTNEVLRNFPIKSILVPTDFSAASEKAAVLAGAIAERYGSKLYVVHTVVNKDSYWVDTNFQLASDRDWGRKETETFVAENHLDRFPHEVIVEGGSTLETATRMVDNLNINLLILGTAGMMGAKKLLFGSHSEQIFRSVRCPVLTVGPHVTPEKCAGKFEHVLFSTDFDYETVDALPYAAEIAREYDARLTLLHVIDAPHHTHGEKVYQQEEFRRAQLLQLFAKGEVSVPHKPEVIVATGDAAEEIVNISVGAGADLIVMGVHSAEHGAARSHALRGHAYPVSVNAHCPVLTIRPREI